MLTQHVTGKDGVGNPCELRLSSKVVSVDPAGATATLESGDKVSGDVVLGADGVHVSAHRASYLSQPVFLSMPTSLIVGQSICRRFLPGGETVAPYDGGHSAFRFLIPMEQLKSDPLTADSAPSRW
jgi:2-polyprenyl-6-methoxyphenol hydroxylase-like FAD-dependent oxidoreductase